MILNMLAKSHKDYETAPWQSLAKIQAAPTVYTQKNKEWSRTSLVKNEKERAFLQKKNHLNQQRKYMYFPFFSFSLTGMKKYTA